MLFQVWIGWRDTFACCLLAIPSLTEASYDLKRQLCGIRQEDLYNVKADHHVLMMVAVHFRLVAGMN